MSPTVDVSSLLGTPYLYGGTNPREGVDCRFATRAALDLIFEDLEGHEFPTSAEEEGAMLTRVRAGETRWHIVGRSAAAATKIGDVLQGRKRDGGAYCAVLVDQLTPLAITATPEHGVHLRRLRSLPGVELVLRRGPPR
jgi:hypothetical protein